jgi:hypothetical protein
VSPTLHALALIAMILGATLACIFMGRPEEGTRKRDAFAVGAGGVGIGFLVPGHLCDAGEPVMQILIGILCAVALTAWVKKPREAASLVLIVAVASAALASRYTGLVHEKGVTGNPRLHQLNYPKTLERRAQDILVERAKTDPESYPAGWLGDWGQFRESASGRTVSRVEVRWWWHSGLTRLYEKRETPIRLWYPGGPLAEGATRLEWRESKP